MYRLTRDKKYFLYLLTDLKIKLHPIVQLYYKAFLPHIFHAYQDYTLQLVWPRCLTWCTRLIWSEKPSKPTNFQTALNDNYYRMELFLCYDSLWLISLRKGRCRTRNVTSNLYVFACVSVCLCLKSEISVFFKLNYNYIETDISGMTCMHTGLHSGNGK